METHRTWFQFDLVIHVDQPFLLAARERLRDLGFQGPGAPKTHRGSLQTIPLAASTTYPLDEGSATPNSPKPPGILPGV